MISRRTWWTVVVAALGYFVDIYDLALFGIVRVASLRDLGVADADLLATGVRLLNWQMSGMLIGGILWGVLGDKRGRLSVLFGSIALYSIANVANGFAHSVDAYAWLRLLAGIGLAGELGAGITLVSELLPKEVRGWGTTVVATVGILGAIIAALVGESFPWRTSYFIGGGLGFALLLLRLGVLESGLFEKLRTTTTVRRGDFLALLSTPERLHRYACVILVGVPIWFVVAILVTFAPEAGKAMGLSPAPTGARAILWCYAGLAAGDLASGALSQVMRSRRKVVGLFLGLVVVAIGVYFAAGGRSLAAFYACCVGLGIAAGYWAVFVTLASEQFGTNLRATVTTTAPNFVRGAVVPVTLAFRALVPHLGFRSAALAIGATLLVLAVASLWRLRETFGRDLDFVEIA